MSKNIPCVRLLRVLHLRNLPDRIVKPAVELDDEELPVDIINYKSGPYFFNIDLGQTRSARKIKVISKGNYKRLVLCEVDVFDGKLELYLQWKLYE